MCNFSYPHKCVSIAGAGSSNVVNSTVGAFIRDSGDVHSVTAADEVVVVARDASSIDADVVGASFSLASVRN